MRRFVMVLVTVLLLVLPAAASAVTTAVTAPADGARFLVDGENLPTVHFAGTADVASVDLKCVSGHAGSLGINTIPIANDVAVTSGSWSTDAAWSNNADGMCEVFAVAHGTTPTTNNDLTGLTGAKVYPGYFDVQVDNGKAWDYYAALSAPHGFYDFDSFGNCTMDYGELLQQHEYDASIFDCNGLAETTDPSDGSQPGVLVDGKPAYTTYYIGQDSGRRNAPGFTGLTFNLTDDAGVWHLTSHEGILQCASGDAFPASSCTAWQSSGIGLDIDERQSTDGRMLTQVLRFVNEDTKDHALSVVLDQTSVDARQWFFPGTSGFQDYGVNDVPSAIAPSVATIRNQIDPPSPESITKGVGGITYAATPTAEQFLSAGDFFVQKYTNVSIPAGRATRIAFVYTMDDTAAHLGSQITAAESSFRAPPAISVTSSHDATAAAYALTGTVNAPEGLTSLTVNNAQATVAGDGSFSVPETLAAGANAFTITATDELGRAATTPFSVNLPASGPPPPTGTNPLAVVFGKSGKPKLKGRVLTTGYTASCPGTGPSCSITATAKAGRKKAGSGKATVNAGAKAKLKVKLTKAAVKQLKRKHKLKLSLKLTGKRTGAATTTTKKTLALKKKR